MQGDMPATRAGPAPEPRADSEESELHFIQVSSCSATVPRPPRPCHGRLWRGNRPTPGREIIAAGRRRCTALLPAEPEPEPGPNPVRPPQLTWSCPIRARSRGSCPVARASANLRLALAQLRLGLCEP